MTVYGANPDDLRNLGAKMRQGADRLESDVVNMVGRQVVASPWQGADADAFVHEWHRGLVPQLRRAVGSLRHSAEQLDRNAQAQEAASAVETSGTPLSALISGALRGGILSKLSDIRAHFESYLDERLKARGLPSPKDMRREAMERERQREEEARKRYRQMMEERKREDEFRYRIMALDRYVRSGVDHDGDGGFESEDLVGRYLHDLYGPDHPGAGSSGLLDNMADQQYLDRVPPGEELKAGDIVLLSQDGSEPTHAVVLAVDEDGNVMIWYQDKRDGRALQYRELTEDEKSDVEAYRPRKERIR